MKKFSLTAVSLCLVCIVTVAAASSLTPNGVPTLTDEAAQKSVEDAYLYILKEYNGQIGIFKAGEETPFKTVEIDLSDLPQGDAEMLKKGIRLYDEQSLQKAVEDYS